MPEELKKNPEPEKEPWIAHLGGSFNPVHDAHMEVVRRLIEVYGFERVVLSPTSSHYDREGLGREEERLQLLKVATRDMAKVAVRDSELGRDAPLSTLDSLTRLHGDLSEEFDNFRVFTIRGSDAVSAMANWRSLDEITSIADIIVVPREGEDIRRLFAELPRLKSLKHRFHLMDSAGIPHVSATQIRRKLIEGRRDSIPVPQNVYEEIRRCGIYGCAEPGQRWISLCRPSYSGRRKLKRDIDRDSVFGQDLWRRAFIWGDRVIKYEDALQLYEDAYLSFLQSHPDVLQWLVKTASDVYDTSESNVLSGTDYGVQETAGTHLQDIAIRKCLVRLGKNFRGDHLVQVRGKNSEGYILNPGNIRFHIPDRILKPEARGWWSAGSIESFWQSNKVLQVKEGVFEGSLKLIVHIAAFGGTDTILARQSGTRKMHLPYVEFDRGEEFDSILQDELENWNLSISQLTPSLAEPVIVKEEVHVMYIARDQIDLSRTQSEYVPVERVTSSRLSKPVKTLLNKVLETE